MVRYTRSPANTVVRNAAHAGRSCGEPAGIDRPAVVDAHRTPKATTPPSTDHDLSSDAPHFPNDQEAGASRLCAAPGTVTAGDLPPGQADHKDPDHRLHLTTGCA